MSGSSLRSFNLVNQEHNSPPAPASFLRTKKPGFDQSLDRSFYSTKPWPTAKFLLCNALHSNDSFRLIKDIVENTFTDLERLLRSNRAMINILEEREVVFRNICREEGASWIACLTTAMVTGYSLINFEAAVTR